ncbi:hypothetical protein GIB67_017294 [Kingdonia uniflora]|uniref:CCHC-type domain-containing protein n=1 Tax=Kingdonia uniflora TaxID=39325 RepID=A0A7J7N3H3_9MAGN|nr:hypothetical protein GIB67_017294 [Kingdonia uniflora]
MERIVGSYDEDYFKMPSLTIELLTVNPGSIIGCSRDDATLQWTGTMVMFKASYDGWLRGCRSVLGLDGCFLKGKYGGVCLSIIGLDGNNARAYRTIDKDNFLAKLGEDHLSVRHCESFNNWILRVRDKPLHKSLEKLNMMMMTLMYDRRTKASIWDQDGLVPRAVAHIAKLKKWYGKFDLAGVDKNKWTATKDGQRYCSEYHCVSTYMKAYPSVVYPVADEASWVKPPKDFRLRPLLRPTGRPRKSRRKDEDELTNGSARICSKCGHYGHNKKTCKGPPAADKVVHNKKKLTRVDTPKSQ